MAAEQAVRRIAPWVVLPVRFACIGRPVGFELHERLYYAILTHTMFV